MSRLHVVAAVIRNPQGQILIAQRPAHKHQGGLWEFPGGKVEAGEAPAAALARELVEELGIQVTAARPLLQVRHDYPDQAVLLDVWQVDAFTGEAHGAEGQPLAWVAPRELAGYDFPAANRPIVQAARLPERYLITPGELTTAELLNGLHRALDSGIRLVQLRTPDNFDPQYRDLAGDVQGLCTGRAQLMLKGPLEWLGDFPAAGWHLTAAQLRRYAPNGRPFPEQRLLAASCHDAEELALAQQMGVDFVTLSPVMPTASHPGAQTLGWVKAQQLLADCNLPAYLLGGLGDEDLTGAWQAGAQGVAAIRAFWPTSA
ncbi:Nudix family hydrolase [Pseudomonas oryzihabitans]|uniref:Nudix family hydrolase n=1 Tax=Pseudomonas oryzihabitans TaxID=47885 RepID=UPI00285586EB|nr:Nudix family hydrolase [Pseudomonas psychrotolerans]MDR6678481.1 8-oxo-dGTP diphosphatase [Pseudomonas psychrotolerans]